MKRIVIAVSASVIMAIVGLTSTCANAQQLTKATGGGVYQHFEFYDSTYGFTGEWYPSDEEVGQFEVVINPEKNSNHAVIHIDGPELRKFWGGPLVLKEDEAVYSYSIIFPDTPKPAQVFGYVVSSYIVWVFTHDNTTPGYNAAPENLSDWFGFWIEDKDTGNWSPDGVASGGQDDDLFTGMGILVRGNITQHTK
jgi:hypothetical protein